MDNGHVTDSIHVIQIFNKPSNYMHPKKNKKTKHKYKNKNLEASSTGLNVKCLLKARAQNHMLILQYNPLNSYKMDRSGPRL